MRGMRLLQIVILLGYPAAFLLGSDQYGVVNWLTELRHTAPYVQQALKSLLGDPITDARVYEGASPLKFLHNLRAPLLVLQGENDPRVPKEESEQVVNILKQEGRTVEAHYYPGEGHGFEKRENEIDAIKRTEQWFDRYLNQSLPPQH